MSVEPRLGTPYGILMNRVPHDNILSQIYNLADVVKDLKSIIHDKRFQLESYFFSR